MITKKELMMRLCEAENNIEWLTFKLGEYEKRLEKLEQKKKGKKNEITK